MSCVTLNNQHDTTYRLLKEFARQHTSSIIYLCSAVMPLAEKAFQELRATIRNEVVVEKGVNNPQDLAKYICAKVRMYYPEI